jgi:hypothetical protein
MQTVPNSLQGEQVNAQQPTAEEDQVEIQEHTALEEKSIQHLKTLDPFLHTVRIFICMLNKSDAKKLLYVVVVVSPNHSLIYHTELDVEMHGYNLSYQGRRFLVVCILL